MAGVFSPNVWDSWALPSPLGVLSLAVHLSFLTFVPISVLFKPLLRSFWAFAPLARLSPPPLFLLPEVFCYALIPFIVSTGGFALLARWF